MRALDPEKVDTLVIHITASAFGDVETITGWHTSPPRNWDTIGYHYLITNCYPTLKNLKHKTPLPAFDGMVVEARSLEFQGAHAVGHNDHTIGIAMVGNTEKGGGVFTGKQLESCFRLINELSIRYNISSIVGHYELDKSKACPAIDMNYFRKLQKRTL